jgi:hypothetical protein
LRELAPSKTKNRLKMVEVACNFCGSQSRQLVTSGMDYEYEVSDDTFQMMKCRDCGLVYMNPRPDVSELPVLYPPHYAPYNVESDFDACSRDSFYYKYVYWLIATGITYFFDRFLPDRKTISALDIGCADGHSISRKKQSLAPGRTGTLPMWDVSRRSIFLMRHSMLYTQGMFWSTFATLSLLLLRLMTCLNRAACSFCLRRMWARLMPRSFATGAGDRIVSPGTGTCSTVSR